MSLHLREVILGTLLPGVVGLVALVYDLTLTIRLPKSLASTLHRLSSPFQDFLALEDLFDPVDFTNTRSELKNRTLAGLALLDSVCWLAFFAYRALLGDSMLATKSLVASVTWVRFPIGNVPVLRCDMCLY